MENIRSIYTGKRFCCFVRLLYHMRWCSIIRYCIYWTGEACGILSFRQEDLRFCFPVMDSGDWDCIIINLPDPRAENPNKILRKSTIELQDSMIK